MTDVNFIEKTFSDGSYLKLGIGQDEKDKDSYLIYFLGDKPTHINNLDVKVNDIIRKQEEDLASALAKSKNISNIKILRPKNEDIKALTGLLQEIYFELILKFLIKNGSTVQLSMEPNPDLYEKKVTENYKGSFDCEAIRLHGDKVSSAIKKFKKLIEENHSVFESTKKDKVLRKNNPGQYRRLARTLEKIWSDGNLVSDLDRLTMGKAVNMAINILNRKGN